MSKKKADKKSKKTAKSKVAVDADLDAFAVDPKLSTPPMSPETPPVTPRAIAFTGPVQRVSVDLPEEWHFRFKAACAGQRERMTAVLQRIIEQETIRLEALPRVTKLTR